MRWKTTLILLAAAIGIGAYLSLYELKQPDVAARKRRQATILNIEPEAVTQITLDLPQAKTTLTRGEIGWTITPHDVRADGALIENLLNSASPLTAERTLSPAADHPLNLKDFGLDPAVGWVTVVTKTATHTLLFGNPTAVGNSRYLKLANQPKVFVVPHYVFSSVDKPLTDFRDHFLIRTNSWLCQELRVKSPTVSYALLRKDNDWRMTAPQEDAADRSAVDALLGRLERLQIRRFVNDAPEGQPDTWGLQQANVEMVVRSGDAKEGITLSFGAKLADDASLIYAKRSDEKPLYAVAQKDLEDFLRDPNTLRQKAFVDFFTANVTQVSLQWGETTWVIQRESDGQWKRQGEKEPLDKTKVEGFLNMLADGRIDTFVEKTENLAQYGLDKPAGKLELTVNDQTEVQQAVLGKPVSGSQARYAQLMPRNILVTLPETVVNLLATMKPEELALAPSR